MEWLRELQQILGDRIRLEAETALPINEEQEKWIPVGQGKFIVVNCERLSHEALDLVELLIQKSVSTLHESENQWFPLLIRQQAEEFLKGIAAKQWEIPLPAIIAVLALHGEETGAAVDVLEKILSDLPGHAVTEGPDARIWLFIPLQKQETLADVRNSCFELLDTLLTELYVGGRMGVSQPAFDLQDLAKAREQAETAFLAGSSYRAGQRLHLFGEMGLAQLLYGVTPEAKTAFLAEVLPPDNEKGLTQELRETIHSFAQHGQNIAETARALFLHRNTLLYRLDKIHEITGKDIRKFGDLLVLWLALQLDQEQNVQ